MLSITTIRRLQSIRAADKVNILYQLLILLLILFNLTKIDFSFLWVAFHVVVLVTLWKLPVAPGTPFFNWLRIWNPLITLPINFRELHYLVHKLNPIDMDNWLIKIDYQIFGLHPTVWLERITHPVLTEYLQLIYSTFYFLPVILIILLLRQQRTKDVDYFMFVMTFGFYLSYIGYFIVPAVGPRFTLEHFQTFPLMGIGLTESIRNILDVLEKSQRDAFPSGHTAMTVLTMCYAYKYHKKYFYVLAVVGSSLIFSTVYLRYHYVADVIAGGILAGLVMLSARYLYGVLSHGFKSR